jgi:galactonate dehydratase
MDGALRRLTLTTAKISDSTKWLFVELERKDLRVGVGEATLGGREGATVAACARVAPLLWSINSRDPDSFARAISLSDLSHAAITSAIDLALWDLYSQDAQLRLVDSLGGAHRTSVPLYSNINRRTKDRTALGFAQSARDALSKGFDALKIAPFDEVSLAQSTRAEGAAAMQKGLARIAAVRELAGPSVRLMVDCHWRFDERSAVRMIDAAAEYGVYWIECPLPEVASNIEALVRLRKQTTRHGMRLAGMEEGIGYESFRPYCEAGCYDVMMPDVKYVGGLRQMLECADQFARQNIEMSPHNPSGPIAHVASLHASAAMRSFDMLEMQFDESPLFDRIVSGKVPSYIGGLSTPPCETGLGIRLAPAALAAYIETPPCAFEAP